MNTCRMTDGGKLQGEKRKKPTHPYSPPGIHNVFLSLLPSNKDRGLVWHFWIRIGYQRHLNRLS